MQDILDYRVVDETRNESYARFGHGVSLFKIACLSAGEDQRGPRPQRVKRGEGIPQQAEILVAPICSDAGEDGRIAAQLEVSTGVVVVDVIWIGGGKIRVAAYENPFS